MEPTYPPLPRDETDRLFQKIFEQPQNKRCFSCGANSRDWASLSNCVFLCLNCASQCRNLKDSICLIKSVNLDVWNEHQIKKLKIGGNIRLKAFLEKYKLNGMPFQEQVCTRACVYYRRKLESEMNESEIEEEPSYEEGREIALNQVDRAKEKKEAINNSDQFMDVAKEKLSAAYQATSKTFGKIGDKLKSPEFRQSMSEFGESVKEKSKVMGTAIKQTSKSGYEKAKSGLSLAWNMISMTFSDMTKK